MGLIFHLIWRTFIPPIENFSHPLRNLLIFFFLLFFIRFFDGFFDIQVPLLDEILYFHFLLYHGVFYFLLSLRRWSSWCFNVFLRLLRLYMYCWKFEPLIMLNEAQPTIFHLFLTMFFLACTYVFSFISSSIFVTLVRPITLFYNFLLPSPNLRSLLEPLYHSRIQSCSNT